MSWEPAGGVACARTAAEPGGASPCPPARQSSPLPLVERPDRDSPVGRAGGASRRGGEGMEIFLQQLINGITLGSIYGLIAIGYTMVFGIIGMVNFAHGDVFMVSTFIALIAFLILTAW